MTGFNERPNSNAPYVWALVVMILVGALLVVAVLVIHPDANPVDVIGKVMEGLAPTIAAVLAFLKSQDTHLMVNGRLDAMIEAHTANAHAEGVIKGASDEQARIAEQLRLAAVVSSIPVAAPPDSTVS